MTSTCDWAMPPLHKNNKKASYSKWGATQKGGYSATIGSEAAEIATQLVSEAAEILEPNGLDGLPVWAACLCGRLACVGGLPVWVGGARC